MESFSRLSEPVKQLEKEGKLKAKPESVKRLLDKIEFIPEFICSICISGAIY